jgi:lipopolysaccharide transport system ATP-binding protein
MADVAIKVEKLGKRFRIGAAQEKYKTFRDTLANAAVAPFRRIASALRADHGKVEAGVIWALKDVSFEVKPGEVVGIIGRNGAGKSTLLKVLSRITEPTEGYAEVYGRIGSLLEVGTGFHPELTGRENIFLNGAILGMKKVEIEKKFDEMVAFAEVEKFIDTPVKHYSSGMYLRLAFAVAAHLEPEILLVDEVLAVGDAEFQKKCLGKMGEVAKEGRTVLFVSHHMGMIAELCSTALLLDRGGVAARGFTRDVVDGYLTQASSAGRTTFLAAEQTDKEIVVLEVGSQTISGRLTSYFRHDEPIVVSTKCRVKRAAPNSVMGFFVKDHKGRKIFTNVNPDWSKFVADGRLVRTVVTIPPCFLAPGQYYVTIAISIPNVAMIDQASDALLMTIIDGGSEYSRYEGYDYGCVFARCEWETWGEAEVVN